MPTAESLFLQSELKETHLGLELIWMRLVFAVGRRRYCVTRDSQFYLAWVLLVSGILVAAPYSRFLTLVRRSFSRLSFSHIHLRATATLLTEGPALLFAMLGTLVWTEAVSQPKVTSTVSLWLFWEVLGIGAR